MSLLPVRSVYPRAQDLEERINLKFLMSCGPTSQPMTSYYNQAERTRFLQSIVVNHGRSARFRVALLRRGDAAPSTSRCVVGSAGTNCAN